MLDFDMLGSPNWGRFVYDGDGSDGGPAGPAGSSVVERLFAEWYASKGLYFETDEFDGRSDYDTFAMSTSSIHGTANGSSKGFDYEGDQLRR